MSFKYKVQQGDTLNKIANKYGFTNYKQAGVSSVPSGNFDLIRVGEEIELGNYDPNKVTTDNSSAPYIVSSLDNAQLFKENKDKLDGIVNEQDIAALNRADKETLNETKDNTADEGTGGVNEMKWDTPDQKLYEMSRLDDEGKANELIEQWETDVEDYLDSLDTRLADIDSVARSSIERIEASSARRINEQKRINKINTDRVRAYGLGSSLYKPIQYSDSITEREREGADLVQQMERERDSAINEALSAAREGESALLSGKMDALNDIEDRIRDKLKEIEEESDKHYKLLQDIRKQEEAKHKALIEGQSKRLSAYIQLHKDEYAGLDAQALEQKILTDMRATGLGFSDVFNTIQSALATDYESEEARLQNEKLQAQINTEKERAKTERSKQTSNNDDGGGSDYTTAQKQRLEQAGISNAGRQQQLDFLHGDKDEYELKYSSGGDRTLRDRVMQAGYDYDAMKEQGISDEDIEKALSG